MLFTTLQVNRPMFEDFVVVTDVSDKATIAAAAKHTCHVVATDNLVTSKGASFNKAGLIRVGQQYVHARWPGCWVLLLDADILLPPQLLEAASKRLDDPTALFGMARYDFLPGPDGHFAVESLSLANGTRYEFDFSGYFQLYHDKRQLYEPWSQNATGSDTRFALGFDRLRVLGLPHELMVFHLGQAGVDHDGVWQRPAAC
jgi:hypothetical protein